MLCFMAAPSAALAAATPSSRLEPPWASPIPAFPSSWFGANMKSFEFDDPKELAVLQKYKQVFASWPELVLSTNFTNSTLVSVEMATKLKELIPDASVFAYNSQWVAAKFYPEARALMEDPQYSDFFVKDANGTIMEYTGYCSQVRVSQDDYPNCIGYYWNWCNETAVDFYLNKVLRPQIADASGKPYNYDGLFLDNADGFSGHGASNVKCDNKAASLAVHIKTGKLFQKYDKWPIFSSTGGAGSVSETNAMWAAGVGYVKFYEYFSPSSSSMIQLLNDTTYGIPCIVHAPTAVKRHPSISLTDALAAFLIASGGAPHTYFQYSQADWTIDKDWPWSPLYEINYGVATGPPTVTYYGVNSTAPKTGEIWLRHYDHGNITVKVNCTPTIPAPPRFEWCKGDISWPGKPTPPAPQA